MSLTSLDSFDKWYIITLENRDTSDIINNLKNAGVTKYEPLFYKPLDKNNTKNDQWTCKNNVCENLFMKLIVWSSKSKPHKTRVLQS